jgi:hypothetical protein
MSSNPEDESALIEALRGAVLRGDQESLQKQTYDLDTHLMEAGYFSPNLFQELLKIIALPEFLALEGSFVLLRVIEYGFDYLTEDQKTKLLEALEESYASFTDFTSCFQIAEIIGESYGGERGLQTLRRLKRSKADMPRSMVPHGLEYFIKKSSDPQLARQAFNELMQMKSDPSDDVRDEVNTSLAQLKRRGWPPPE